MSKTKTHATPMDWLADAEDVPREGMPDTAKLHKRAKWFRVFVWMCIVLCPITTLLALSAASKPPAQQSAKQAVPPVSSTPGEAVATQALRNWLASTPAPLPGGQIVSWDGADHTPAAKATKSNPDVPIYAVEVDHFTVTNRAGALFECDVQVALDPRGGQVVLGSPSLLPKAAPLDDGWQDGGPWPGLSVSTSAPAPVSQAIGSWLDAYTSGDANALHLAIGDPKRSDFYMPLSVVKNASFQLTYAAPFGPAKNGEMLAEISATLTWKGQKQPSTSSWDTTTVPSATYDLLVQQANTAAPVVVAWGGPGTGPTLKPYADAVTDGSSRAQPTSSGH